MGSRYISYTKCLQCGEKYEIYDAPSSLMYIGVCDCGYHDPGHYHEEENTLLFCKEEHKEED